MGITRFAVCVSVVSVFFVPGDHGALARAGTGLSFTLDDSGLILVPISLGGLGGQACVLDTGASRTIVSDRLAARLGLTAVARAEVLSSAGTSTHEVVRLPPLTLAGVTRTELFATVLPAARVRALSEEAACVIGQDFLSSQDYTIDYERRTLSWDSQVKVPPDGPCRTVLPKGSACVALAASEGRYVVELRQSDGADDSVRLVPDSGASDIVLFRQPQMPALPLAPLFAPLRGMLSAATGRREVSEMRLERLRVGSIELRDRPVYVVDRRTEAGTGAQGLLPLRLFARVSFRKAEGTMVVTAR